MVYRIDAFVLCVVLWTVVVLSLRYFLHFLTVLSSAVLDSTTDLYWIDALLLFVVSWRCCGLPFGSAFSLFISPSIFLTVFSYDAQLDSQRSLDRCFVLCVVLWTVWSTLWFCFCFFFLLSPATCLTVLFYDARLKSDFLLRHLTDLRTFLPFFAFDVTILCLHLS